GRTRIGLLRTYVPLQRLISAGTRPAPGMSLQSSIYHGASTQTLVGHLWLSENLCCFRILALLRGFYDNARHNQCESDEANRHDLIAAPPLMHRKAHAGSRDQQRHQDDHADL